MRIAVLLFGGSKRRDRLPGALICGKTWALRGPPRALAPAQLPSIQQMIAQLEAIRDSLGALVHTSADVDLNTEEDPQTSLFFGSELALRRKENGICHTLEDSGPQHGGGPLDVCVGCSGDSACFPLVYD